MDYDQEPKALEWESIEEKDITNELTGFSQRCGQVTKQLNAMIAYNECKKTEDALQLFAYNDLGSAGWVSSFHQINMDSFSKYMNGSSRPSWYSELPLDKQKRYDMIMQYYKDTAALLNPFTELSTILLNMVSRQSLKEGFRLVYLMFNLFDAGIDEKTYKQVEIDARQVSSRINKNWGDMERIAVSAGKFLEDNRSRMDFGALQTGYRKARLQDYMNDFRNSAISDSFGILSDGSFYVKSGILAKVRAIDKYTMFIAQTEYIEDVMKDLLDKCKNLLNKQLIPSEKAAATEACGIAFMAVRKLVMEIITFAETVLDTFKQYKDANPDESPYCFMRPLSAYDVIQSRYGLSPNKSDPWDTGTKYTDLYIMEAVALTEHCEDFVNNHGNVNLR